MSEGPIWFKPKRFGFGTVPISWQGWALTLGLIALAILVMRRFQNQPIVAAAILVPAVIVMLIIAAKTTRGGWRWRWGADD